MGICSYKREKVYEPEPERKEGEPINPEHSDSESSSISIEEITAVETLDEIKRTVDKWEQKRKPLTPTT